MGTVKKGKVAWDGADDLRAMLVIVARWEALTGAKADRG